MAATGIKPISVSLLISIPCYPCRIVKVGSISFSSPFFKTINNRFGVQVITAATLIFFSKCFRLISGANWFQSILQHTTIPAKCCFAHWWTLSPKTPNSYQPIFQNTHSSGLGWKLVEYFIMLCGKEILFKADGRLKENSGEIVAVFSEEDAQVVKRTESIPNMM